MTLRKPKKKLKRGKKNPLCTRGSMTSTKASMVSNIDVNKSKKASRKLGVY